jgi:hypothetical protein
LADAFIWCSDGEKSAAILSEMQKRHYGTYLEAIRALKVDLILSPLGLDAEDWGDLDVYHEVGHA